MNYENFIISVNIASIVFLMVLAFLLLAATRFRGESGYGAAIIVLPNVPVYLYNMSRMVGWHDMATALFPLAFSVNTTLMPLLWLFTLRNFTPAFRLRRRHALHFVPALVSLVLALSFSREEVLSVVHHEMGGDDTWLGNINSVVIMVQLIGYFTAIFVYIKRQKRYILDNCSDAEYMQKAWITGLMYLFATLFVIVMTSYIIAPRTDAWLIPILNVIAMAYLVYNSIAHPAILPHHVAETLLQPAAAPAALGEVQMDEICHRVQDFLIASHAYLRPDLSLAMLAKETGIPQKNLSRAINTHLGMNFFDLINRLRIEKAKQLLLAPGSNQYTIDSVYEQCGFRSRSTFFLAFKKAEKQSPAQWLKGSKS